MNKRLLSIDLIRGLAIIAMIQVHLWSYQIAVTNNLAQKLYELMVRPLGGYAPPLFTLIAGLSAHLAIVAKLDATGQLPKQARILFMKRGFVLFLFSTIINVFTGPILHILNISLLNWSIFQLVGFCLILAPIFFLFNRSLKIVWLITTLGLAYLPALHETIFASFFQGFAPFFPWSFLFFAGMLVGAALNKARRSVSLYPFAAIGTSGALLLLAAFLGLQPQFPYYPSHIGLFNLTNAAIYMGVFLILVTIFYYLVDLKGVRNSVLTSIVGLGQHSLTIYYLQLFVIVVSAMVIFRIFGTAPQLNPLFFPPLLLAILVAFHLVINIGWAKFDYRYTLEWFLNGIVKGQFQKKFSRQNPLSS